MKFEGHSCIFHLILKLAMTLGLTYQYIWLIPFIISIIGIYLLIYKVDLPLLVKALFIINPCVLICASLARPYCLIFLFLVLLLTVYKKRFEKNIKYGIILFLLFNTHTVVAGFIAGLYLIDIIDFIKSKDKTYYKLIKSYLIGILGFIFLFLQVNGSTNYINNISFKNINEFLEVLFFSVYGFIKFMTKNDALVFYFFILLLYIVINIFRNRNSYKFFLILNYLYIIGVRCFIYRFSFEFTSIIFLMPIIFYFVIYGFYNNKLKVALYSMLIISLLGSYTQIKNEIKYNFSFGNNAAAYINENYENQTFYCVDDYVCTNIVPSLKKGNNIISFLHNNKVSYVTWTTDNEFSNDYMKKIINSDVEYLIIGDKFFSLFEDDLSPLLENNKIEILSSFSCTIKFDIYILKFNR